MDSKKKLIEVIFNQVSKIPDRCEGYRKELRELLADVVYLEHEHAISRIDVVKKITDKVNASGKFYHENKSDSEIEKEDL